MGSFRKNTPENRVLLNPKQNLESPLFKGKTSIYQGNNKHQSLMISAIIENDLYGKILYK